MRPLEDVLVDLAAAVMASAEDPARGVAVRVDRARLTVPIESRWLADGSFCATLPRHRLATGFDAPFAQLMAVWAEDVR